MKVYITIAGDRSVGIPDGHVTVDFEGIHFDASWNRSELKKTLKENFAEIFDEDPNRVGVQFEDECGDCGSKIEEHKSKETGRPLYYLCSNPNCISNIPEEEDFGPEEDESNHRLVENSPYLSEGYPTEEELKRGREPVDEVFGCKLDDDFFIGSEDDPHIDLGGEG